MENERISNHEIHLDTSHWNNLDAKNKNWSEYNRNSDQMRQREELVKKLIELIKGERLPKLTERQRQIIQLYFDFQLNEEAIARILGISQPTVSQHIFGKKRNGKKIGGAIRKIRKIILKISCYKDTSIPQSEYILVFQKLLDSKISLRRKISLLKTLKI
ncbi:MAG: sigma factor-like helix-turn-helix DNA-binding protein [Planctomycetota bacterium]